jgi:SAM-dependent methyltransferase
MSIVMNQITKNGETVMNSVSVTGDQNPLNKLMELSMGFTLPRTLHVVAELGIADALGEAPQSAEDLAATTGTHAGALSRALRLLSAHGVFQKSDGAYAHTAASRLLRSDHPQSVRPFVRMQGIPALWHIWEHLDHSLKTGRSATEKALPHGGFWGYFADHPEHSRIFNDAMTGKSHGQTAGILAAYDFSGFRSIVDIGGGNGHLLQAVLAAAPKLEGVLFDLPKVIEQASAVASSRLKLQGGSFFEDPLPVCDAYFLMQVLHDWSDEEAERILKSIRRAAPPNAKLLIAEWLVPEDGKPSWTFFVDMIMMTELTGKERTQPEFKEMLARTGFRLDRVIDAGFNTFILEASAI